MITCQEKALEHMKLGLFDVLPSGSMDGLTAEDFRLLLNGVGDINVQTLISYTSFNDESGESPDRLVAIKRYNSFTNFKIKLFLFRLKFQNSMTVSSHVN